MTMRMNRIKITMSNFLRKLSEKLDKLANWIEGYQDNDDYRHVADAKNAYDECDDDDDDDEF